MNATAIITATFAAVTLAACGGTAAPVKTVTAPAPTVTVTEQAAPAPAVTVTKEAAPAPESEGTTLLTLAWANLPASDAEGVCAAYRMLGASTVYDMLTDYGTNGIASDITVAEVDSFFAAECR